MLTMSGLFNQESSEAAQLTSSTKKQRPTRATRQTAALRLDDSRDDVDAMCAIKEEDAVDLSLLQSDDRVLQNATNTGANCEIFT